MKIPNLMLQTDMANRWGVSRKVVNNWTKRDPNFPKPVQIIGQGKYPIYLETDVLKYERLKGLANAMKDLDQAGSKENQEI